jgi:excinuclease ABC subunit A
LKNIDLDLPRDRLIVLPASRVGKSSLADAIYAEDGAVVTDALPPPGQFLSMIWKSPTSTALKDSPRHLNRAKSTSHNPRSTVGTVTEIRLFALLCRRAGARCPDHPHRPGRANVPGQMVDAVLELSGGPP